MIALRHAGRVAAQSCTRRGWDQTGVTRPTYVDRPEGFVWARTNDASNTGNRIVRYTLHGSRLSYATGTPNYNSSAWAGRTCCGMPLITTPALSPFSICVTGRDPPPGTVNSTVFLTLSGS